MDESILELWEIIWDYHHMNLDIKKSDIIIVLGSHDIRVADRWIELFKQWYAPLILFSGGLWRLTSESRIFWWSTEADFFARRAIEQWISLNDILIENKSTNTGENIIYSFEKVKDMSIKSVILVQKPYMERRTFATFAKQRPNNKDITFTVTSPQIAFSEYCNDEIPLEQVINIMVGDLQRIIEYPALGFQIYQEVPWQVMDAYNTLVSLGFTNALIHK